MSLPIYAEYKDSGVEWLGLVPAHWSMKRLRTVAELNPSKSEISAFDRETEVSFLPMEAIGDDGAAIAVARRCKVDDFIKANGRKIGIAVGL